MPSIPSNVKFWEDYDWGQRGEEWSRWWGGPDAQWYGTILPRIHSFLPAGSILEIAPGYGRWTQYLKDHCERLVAVDLNARCIEACKARFSSSPHVTCFVNDGRSLEMIQDRSVDFAFSFDSLVHVEPSVIKAYLEQLAVKLTPNGVGFFHHSNLRMYAGMIVLAKRMPSRLRSLLVRRGALINWEAGWRDEGMDAVLFEEYCDRVGLACIGQELINWESEGGKYLRDGLSMFTLRGSVWARPNRIVRNPAFMVEATLIGKLSSLYRASSFKSKN